MTGCRVTTGKGNKDRQTGKGPADLFSLFCFRSRVEFEIDGNADPDFYRLIPVHGRLPFHGFDRLNGSLITSVEPYGLGNNRLQYRTIPVNLCIHGFTASSG